VLLQHSTEHVSILYTCNTYFVTGVAKSTIRVVQLAIWTTAFSIFYLSVDDQNSNIGALFAIQNVVPTRIKYIPNRLVEF